MTGRGIDQVLRRPVPPQLHEACVRDARDYVRLAERVNGPIPAPVPADYPWGDALAEIGRQAPDAVVVNLETAITTADGPWPGKAVHYRMSPANIGCLQAGRIDICALANNHVLDWGRDGLVQTLRSLAAAGLRSAGAGMDDTQARAPAVLRLGAGHRLLVFSWAAGDSGVPPEWAAAPSAPGIARLHDVSDRGLRQVAAAVNEQRRAGDIVLLSIHWGANQVAAVPQEHRRFAHALIDLGLVDLVHGHSAHHPLPVEMHRGKLVLYGCGDLINDYEGIRAPAGHLPDTAGLFFATISPASGELVQLRIVPMQRRAFRLVRADAVARASIRHALRLNESGLVRRLPSRRDGHWVLEPPPAARAPAVHDPKGA